MRRAALTLTFGAVAGAGAIALLGDGSGPTAEDAAKPERPQTRRLSGADGSRWAYVRAATPARGAPRSTAMRVARISLETSVRTREVVLAIAERRGANGRLWTRVRFPVRPPRRATGWVPRRSLGAYHLTTTRLRIDRGTLTATLRDAGRAVWRAPVAIGTTTNPTPPGRFYVRSRIVPTEGGVVEPGGFYGVFAFGTSGYAPNLSDWPGGGVVGIHGTNRPDLIPGRVSHGCVRVRNAEIARLRELMPLGTPVEIVG